MILFLYFPLDTEIRNGNLKAILGLFFSLSRYKQQQHHQQQYYQSLVELQQRVTHASPQAEASQAKTQQDMQSREGREVGDVLKMNLHQWESVGACRHKQGGMLATCF